MRSGAGRSTPGDLRGGGAGTLRAVRELRRRIGRLPEGSPALTGLRLGYRAAYLTLASYWRLRHPDGRGAQLVLVDDDRVLLVRHTYRAPSTWMLPGGGVRRSEAFRSAAVREADEELGLSLHDLTLLLSYTTYREHRHDELTVFLAELPREADLVIDRAELAEARWWPLDGLPGSLDEDDHGVLEALPGRRVGSLD